MINLHTIGTVGAVIHQTLVAEGIDADKLMTQAGISPNLIHDPNYRLSFEKMDHLARLAQDASNDPCLGLKLHDYVHPTTFFSLGFAMLASETLKDLINHYIRYYRLISNKDTLTLKSDGDTLSLVSHLATDLDIAPLRVDGWASITMKILHMAYAADYKPLRVELSRPKPIEHVERYERFFGCKVIFDTPESALVLASEDLKKPLPTANPELSKLYEGLTIEYLRELDRSDFPSSVATALTELIPQCKAGKEIVARALNVSPRTLYNKLECAGTSYKEILNQTRFDMTKEYLKNGIPMPEIAYLLGFSDYGNFSRAFKSWTGVSPRDYRASLNTTQGQLS
ncbi:AraC family transcriptional regulator [Porticoccaceae bacterium nBUS_17]